MSRSRGVRCEPRLTWNPPLLYCRGGSGFHLTFYTGRKGGMKSSPELTSSSTILLGEFEREIRLRKDLHELGWLSKQMMSSYNYDKNNTFQKRRWKCLVFWSWYDKPPMETVKVTLDSFSEVSGTQNLIWGINQDQIGLISGNTITSDPPS